ncbi:I78 family peptidase inhibitor [Parasphingorhabdus sp.]|uniref:I78 family peptidase inhibitor n=1 Tax=Parasphingorhabdus sp. TaxID=2709688 RepID=UPI003593A302
MRMEIPIIAFLALSACATDGTESALPPPPPGTACDASGLQDHIGHVVSAKSGETLLDLSGARVLRWVPPRTAVTMDYRDDRLTVSYDDDMVITRISCG